MAGSWLNGKLVLVTGAARRIGRGIALACAREGADVVIHYHSGAAEALAVQAEIRSMGRSAWTIQADFRASHEAERLLLEASEFGRLAALVNNAAIFEPLSLERTELADWERHLQVNLTAPFLLARGFARQLGSEEEGRIVNVLDWRGTRPAADHFPYTITKAALASMTRSMAQSLAPRIAVNGLALGAILPPEGRQVSSAILEGIPAGRWGNLADVEQALVFLLTGPAYITGEVIHVDGGRHLT